ncbi:uncharacterized protein [Panulirus ornatus]|uniref:uncharacterized protein isoform X1 n=1 Tax=Panulirus ornatus TaxID=150431 RepID=UPI003A8B609B
MAGEKALLLWLVAVLANMAPLGNAFTMLHQHNSNTTRDEKLIVVIKPSACQGSTRTGTCLPYFQCAKVSGGDVDGKCSYGLGECCVFERTCGASSPASLTYFTSRSKDATVVGTCALTITKGNNICQLRLYMKELELSEPNADGVCVKQYLEVQGISGGAPRICGTNSGQHLYVDVRADTGPYKVGVVNMDNNPLSSWDIEVQQVPCDSDERLAPTGCSQYYTGVSGHVKSFNYATQPTTQLQANGDPGSRHLQETYTICVRQEPGYCSLKWTPAPGDAYAFTLTGNLIANPNIPLPIFNVATDQLCPFTDYLVITDGRIPLETGTTSVFCGSLFPESVTSDSFRATVVANDQEFADDDLDNRGFHLQYDQVAC